MAVVIFKKNVLAHSVKPSLGEAKLKGQSVLLWRPKCKNSNAREWFKFIFHDHNRSFRLLIIFLPYIYDSVGTLYALKLHARVLRCAKMHFSDVNGSLFQRQSDNYSYKTS